MVQPGTTPYRCGKMREWLKGSDNPKSQQVAFKFMNSKELVKFQKQEKQFIDNRIIDSKQEEEQGKDNDQAYPVPSFDTARDYSKLSLFPGWSH